MNGYSLVELSFVIALVATLTGVAVPQVLTALDDYRTAGAARYVATRVQRMRMEAVMRSTTVAMQFVETDGGVTFAVYVDGNGDGVRTRDIQRAVDWRLGPVERLSDHFRDVDFGVSPGLPPVEPAAPPPGTDPIKLGASNLLSFSSAGTSSSGSLYLRGRTAAQYVIRVLGETGRVRVLKFDASSRRWKS